MMVAWNPEVEPKDLILCGEKKKQSVVAKTREEENYSFFQISDWIMHHNLYTILRYKTWNN